MKSTHRGVFEKFKENKCYKNLCIYFQMFCPKINSHFIPSCLFFFFTNFLKHLYTSDSFILCQTLFSFLGQNHVKMQRKAIAQRTKLSLRYHIYLLCTHIHTHTEWTLKLTSYSCCFIQIFKGNKLGTEESTKQRRSPINRHIQAPIMDACHRGQKGPQESREVKKFNSHQQWTQLIQGHLNRMIGGKDDAMTSKVCG